ncbi:CoA-transferase family III domain-containing protein [Ilyonectria destructans]|nr:CoA-transferase family III domain-containing protein [Ilyonectria destructans]
MRSSLFLVGRNLRLSETAKFRTHATSKNNRLLAARHYSSSLDLDSKDNEGPLRGLRVLDLSRVLAAPFCTQILADYGADIIKVEAVGKGDDTRHWMMQGETAAWKKEAGPMSNYFSAVNRNKRSMTLDLKHPKGKEIFLGLMRKTDVLIENFKPGTMERLGIGYSKLKDLNPGLIYASISGYGTTGPYANRGGYDPIAGAEAGLLHVTGERKGPPVRPGLGVVDMATGLYLHGAILAALHARERTGKGQRVDGSLLETQISLLTNVGLSWLNLGIEAERWGCQHPSIVPYDAFKTKDLYLVCGATNDSQFAALCKLVGLDSLVQDGRFITNPKRVENRELLGPIFNAVFETKTTAEWVRVFDGKGLPFAPINNIEMAFSHPQVQARDMIAHVPHDATESGHIKLIGPAVKFSETKATIRSLPPRLGEHTDEILAEAGIDQIEIENFRQQGIV